MTSPFSPLPSSWSGLSWRQLCDCWRCKMRYGGNADVARAAALLALLGLEAVRFPGNENTLTGEKTYTLRDGDGGLWTVTARELSQTAKAAMPWFDWPYGDPGKEAVKDDNGKVVEEAVDPVRGYVNPDWRDAMALPEQEMEVDGVLFALPSVACNNLTWQQYRALQALAPQLFREGNSDGEAMELQAEFLAQMLVPARDNGNTADRFAPKHDFTYNTDRAEQTVVFWKKRLTVAVPGGSAAVIFHICFQCYQTALTYYAAVYPLLFNDDGKNSKMQDALQGEVGTINTVMKYAGYAEQQQVYDSNLPFILDILNTMTKEAKQIEAMNAKIKSKK